MLVNVSPSFWNCWSSWHLETDREQPLTSHWESAAWAFCMCPAREKTLACLYFFKPITIVLSSAKPSRQQQCPSKIVMWNCLGRTFLWKEADTVIKIGDFLKEPSRPALFQDPIFQNLPFLGSRLLTWRFLVFFSFCERDIENGNSGDSGKGEKAAWHALNKSQSYTRHLLLYLLWLQIKLILRCWCSGDIHGSECCI